MSGVPKRYPEIKGIPIRVILQGVHTEGDSHVLYCSVTNKTRP